MALERSCGPENAAASSISIGDRGQPISSLRESVLQTVIVCEFDQFAEIGQRAIKILPLLDARPDFADPAHDALGVFGVVPESLDSALSLEVGEFALVIGEVKVAPRADQPAREVPRPLLVIVQMGFSRRPQYL